MRRPTVLVTSAGAGPGVAVIKALKRQNQLPLNVVAADMDPTAAGLFLADDRVLLPAIKSPSFEPAIQNVIKQKHVDYVIPILDTETPFFAAHRDVYRLAMGVHILVSPSESIRIANDKLASHDLCIQNNIPTPRLYSRAEIDSLTLNYPLLVKPRFGVGSTGIKIVTTERMMTNEIPIDEDSLVFEFLNGPEYSVDTISDFSGRCLAAAPRQRLLVKAGQSIKGRTVKDPALTANSVRAAEVFGLEGPGCVQWIVVDGTAFFVEMNPRYGTGVSLSIAAGLNMPLIQLKLAMGVPLTDEDFRFRDDCFMSRYWEEVFFDGTSFAVL